MTVFYIVALQSIRFATRNPPHVHKTLLRSDECDLHAMFDNPDGLRDWIKKAIHLYHWF